MACSSCGKSGVYSLYTENQQARIINNDCDYNLEQLIDWKNKLFCVRDNEYFSNLQITKKDLNSYIGIVLSGITLEYNICFLVDQLDRVKPVIIKIISIGLC